MGMTCDLRNMLRHAAETIDESGNDTGGYAFMLRQLGEHLQEVHNRWSAGDESVIREFFDLYVMHTPTEPTQ